MVDSSWLKTHAEHIRKAFFFPSSRGHRNPALLSEAMPFHHSDPALTPRSGGEVTVLSSGLPSPHRCPPGAL